jgi:hypothetical protein
MSSMSASKDSSVKRSRLQFGCARITSAICGSVNLILVVDFIGHIKRDRGWLPFHPLLVAPRPALDLLIGAKHLSAAATASQP